MKLTLPTLPTHSTQITHSPFLPSHLSPHTSILPSHTSTQPLSDPYIQPRMNWVPIIITIVITSLIILFVILPLIIFGCLKSSLRRVEKTDRKVVCVFGCLLLSLFVCVSECLHLCLFVCVYDWLHVCLTVSWFMCLSVFWSGFSFFSFVFF